MVGFCLGVELTSDPSFKLRRHLLAILVFSLGPILGIGIGMSLVDLNPSNSVVIPILQGIAGGTLLYVTVCEVLPREKARWHKNQFNKCAGIIQLFSFILGFTLMTFLNVFISKYYFKDFYTLKFFQNSKIFFLIFQKTEINCKLCIK